MYQNVVQYGALDERQVAFETDFAVLVSKESSLPLSTVTSPWLRTLVLMRDPRTERFFLCEVYIEKISSNHVAWPALSHTIFTCVSCVSIHVVYIRVYIHIVLRICSGSRDASHLGTTIKFDWTNFFSSVIPRIPVCQVSFLPVNHNYHKLTLNHMVPCGW